MTQLRNGFTLKDDADFEESHALELEVEVLDPETADSPVATGKIEHYGPDHAVVAGQTWSRDRFIFFRP